MMNGYYGHPTMQAPFNRAAVHNDVYRAKKDIREYKSSDEIYKLLNGFNVRWGALSRGQKAMCMLLVGGLIFGGAGVAWHMSQGDSGGSDTPVNDTHSVPLDSVAGVYDDGGVSVEDNGYFAVNPEAYGVEKIDASVCKVDNVEFSCSKLRADYTDDIPSIIALFEKGSVKPVLIADEKGKERIIRTDSINMYLGVNQIIKEEGYVIQELIKDTLHKINIDKDVSKELSESHGDTILFKGGGPSGNVLTYLENVKYVPSAKCEMVIDTNLDDWEDCDIGPVVENPGSLVTYEKIGLKELRLAQDHDSYLYLYGEFDEDIDSRGFKVDFGEDVIILQYDILAKEGERKIYIVKGGYGDETIPLPEKDYKIDGDKIELKTNVVQDIRNHYRGKGIRVAGSMADITLRFLPKYHDKDFDIRNVPFVD